MSCDLFVFKHFSKFGCQIRVKWLKFVFTYLLPYLIWFSILFVCFDDWRFVLHPIIFSWQFFFSFFRFFFNILQGIRIHFNLRTNARDWNQTNLSKMIHFVFVWLIEVKLNVLGVDFAKMDSFHFSTWHISSFCHFKTEMPKSNNFCLGQTCFARLYVWNIK